MKKIFLLTLVLFSLSTFKTIAQCAPDTTLTTPGIYPKNLPDAKEDSLYDEVVQFKMPKDTQSFLGLVKFDSITIMSITGIPSGITYACGANPGFSACTWAGGANGCLRVYGKPDSGTAGIHRCVIKLRAYVYLVGNVTFFETSDTLSFNVRNASQPNGMVIPSYSGVSLYPNPAEQKLYITGSRSFASESLVTIYDLAGRAQLVMTWNEVSSGGIDVSLLPKGLYILRISDGSTFINARFQH